ncbi:BRO-N domain-containing protein [Oceanospirillum beijerinckii]|uniref:BRO-N domain-containing protein n=1 Tax=Oceanospirillum beijerinckii TaxID=64976 RepID=UPI0003F8D58D|nr:Bro-N domain-containing protein [Oceanospirillum beijerinckii]
MEKMAFENTDIEFLRIDNQIWVRGTQIGDALDYENSYKAMSKLYERNKDEFTESMTTLMKLPDLHPQIGGAGQIREVRVFSLRGAHLIAMFARTEKAKAFRRWVLDLLEDFHNGTENAKLRYIKAQKELEQAKQQASSCG